LLSILIRIYRPRQIRTTYQRHSIQNPNNWLQDLAGNFYNSAVNIRVLGSRGEIDPTLPYHSRHSGVLVDNSILFDLGEKEFLKYNPEYIFITHLHPDHAFFVTEPFESNILLYAPEKYKNLKIEILVDRTEFEGFSITPVPTHHSKRVRSTAYLLEKEGKKVLYTGDLIWINKEYHSLIGSCDLVITDGSFLRKGGRITRDKETGQIYGHGGIPDLINLLKSFTESILFVHFGSWFYDNVKESRLKLKQLAYKEDVNILVGFDGLKIEL
jgi:ribonuclease BN (tRNA processing enzyme)